MPGRPGSERLVASVSARPVRGRHAMKHGFNHAFPLRAHIGALRIAALDHHRYENHARRR